MSVRCLSCVVYSENGREWHLEKIANPSWDRIIDSVSRLDRFRYPWVWLFVGDEDEDASVDCLTIMGGEGVYWIGLSAGRYEQLRLSDPSKGEQEVVLWTSDQGFADSARHVTDDLNLVLRIAQHFGETSEPLADASWESG